RDLIALGARIQHEAMKEELAPDQIAGLASSEFMRIAISAVSQHELEHLGDAGRDFLRELQRRQRLKALGIQTGAHFGIGAIDAFLLLFADTPMDSNQADNERVIFLKNALAKEFDIAIICIAHTRKGIERPDKRPRLADLRGSGAISAFADYVALMYRPWTYA